MADSLPEKDENTFKELKTIIKDAKNRLEKNNASNESTDIIQIATVLKNKLSDYQIVHDRYSQSKYRRWLAKTFLDKEPNEKHKLIVSTKYPFILTSNYDMLLEDAANSLGLYGTYESYTFKDQLQIMSAIHQSKNCIIHVHGSADSLSLDELIFTKEDYNKMILKRYEGFSFALRMLFTRYSTLFVGYGISDPHLEEVFEEISEYFPIDAHKKYPLPESFIVSKRNRADSILDRFKGRVRTNLIIIDDFSDYITLLKELRDYKPKTKKKKKKHLEHSHQQKNCIISIELIQN